MTPPENPTELAPPVAKKLSLSAVEPVKRPKSKAAQIADLLPEIEAALASGHPHRTIFEDVKKTIGLDLTFGYYENTIHRMRQRREFEATSKDVKRPVAKSSRSGPSPVLTASGNGAPTSKLQAALAEDVDDFFS